MTVKKTKYYDETGKSYDGYNIGGKTYKDEAGTSEDKELENVLEFKIITEYRVKIERSDTMFNLFWNNRLNGS